MANQTVPGLYKRGKHWYINILVNGVRVHKSSGSTKLPDAMKALAKAQEEAREKSLSPLERVQTINFEEACDRVMEDFYSHLNPVREREQRSKFDFWVKVIGKKTMLNHIDESSIDDGLVLLRRRGLAGGTLNRYVSAISKVMTWAKKKRYIQYKPEMDRARENKGRIVCMSKAQEEEALLYLSSFPFPFAEHLASVIPFCIDTGLRRGEVVAIRFGYHITLDGPEPHLYLTSDITKSGVERTVPLTERAQRVLQQRFDAGYTDRPWPYVADTLSHGFDSLKKGLKLPQDKYYGIHMLRHTFCTRLVEKGVNIKDIKDLAGHASIVTTQRYLQSSPKRLRHAINLLEPSTSEGQTSSGSTVETVAATVATKPETATRLH